LFAHRASAIVETMRLKYQFSAEIAGRTGEKANVSLNCGSLSLFPLKFK
jgi:hypothetical protein